MEIVFENVLERDFDFLIMNRFAKEDVPFMMLFLNKTGLDLEKLSIDKISHSVMTNDGETDVEIILKTGETKVGLLIEDKIDAVAQPEQSSRYKIRADRAVVEGKYSSYYIFIVAPLKYLDGNKEASKYEYRVSYEEILAVTKDAFEKAIVEKALDESKHGYVPVEDRNVTEFWNHIYDYVEEHFPDTFRIHGIKGESRGANAQWIRINSAPGTTIQIKADRGYVDLEIAGYADKFQKFSKDNQFVLDRKRLYVRMASKSLAIRKYFEPIDFRKNFSEQLGSIEDAFEKAKELQDLVKDLKY